MKTQDEAANRPPAMSKPAAPTPDVGGAHADPENSLTQIQTQPLSEAEIIALDEHKTTGWLLTSIFFVAPVMLLARRDDFSFGILVATLAVCCCFAVARLLGHYSMIKSLQADMEAGIKRVTTARVVDARESDEPPYFRLELLTDETPAQTFHFTAPPNDNPKVEKGERVRIAYAPASKTLMNISAASYEYARAVDKTD